MQTKETMTSRQRVIAAVEHREADRMPLDLGMHFSTGISVFAYYNLRKYLGLSLDKVELVDPIQCLARVDDDIIERFHLDTILLNPPFPNSHRWNPRDDYEFVVPEHYNPIRQPDGSHRFSYKGEDMYMPAGTFFFNGGWPDFYDMDLEEKHKYFAARAERIYKETDKYTMMMGFNAFFGGLDFACDMLTDPEECIAFNENLLKEQIKIFDSINQKMGKYINCIEVNSDLGTQQNLMCTPDSYRECCFPFLQQFCRYVHENSDIHVFIHSCGAIRKLIPQIIEAGVDILNPVQISADGMDSQELKDTFGKEICFWGGGCNTQTVLPVATPEQVADHVRHQVAVFKPHGGFVFNQVHNVMGDVPPENIVTMLDTAYENSFYETKSSN